MAILMCAQKLTDASLIYRTEPKTKTIKMKKTKNQKWICSEETVPGGSRPTRVVEKVRPGYRWAL